nr:hypothetical protein [uncultured Noviherbaspirillum sp.]
MSPSTGTHVKSHVKSNGNGNGNGNGNASSSGCQVAGGFPTGISRRLPG